MPKSLREKLTELKKDKIRFFLGGERGPEESEIKKKELNLFKEILDRKINVFEESIKNKRRYLEELSQQQKMFANIIADAEDKVNQIENEIKILESERKRLKITLDALSPDRPVPFVWDIAFVEIFEDDNPGFDIVIGNPPYVRQERIRDYLERFSRREYLNRLNEGLHAIYPTFMGRIGKISGRADYYVYFYLHALSLLADRGTFCFITSNSWLDVDFGKDLQAFFILHGDLKMIIDNRAKRSFSQADVNTVIVLAGTPLRRRHLTEEEMKRQYVRLVAFKVPFEEALSPVIFSEIDDDRLYKPMAQFEVLKRPEFRVVKVDKWTLWKEGLEDSAGRSSRDVGWRKYKGDKWGGKYLRAPDIFFTILEKGQRYAAFRYNDDVIIVEDITDTLED
jgi:hypothetical protein